MRFCLINIIEYDDHFIKLAVSLAPLKLEDHLVLEIIRQADRG